MPSVGFNNDLECSMGYMAPIVFLPSNIISEINEVCQSDWSAEYNSNNDRYKISIIENYKCQTQRSAGWIGASRDLKICNILIMHSCWAYSTWPLFCMSEDAADNGWLL